MGSLTTTPVENTTWDQPGGGRYRIAVVNLDDRGHGSVSYRITVRQQGKPDRLLAGMASPGQLIDVGVAEVSE